MFTGGITINNEKKIAARIARLLRDESVDRVKFRKSVSTIAEQNGDEVYCALLYTAAHLEFSKRVARKHFQEVMAHWDTLSARAGRDVDFRVALLDYYLAFNRRIRNPKIIEIKVFEQTRKETEIDELTQLHNFRYFSKTLEKEVLRSGRYRVPLSMVLFDVDDFKHYNDSNGHLAGNKALKKLAGIIRKTVREVDIVARFGGEEFVLLLPETNREGAFTIADRIRQAVANSSFANGKQQPLQRFTVSGGVATLHVDADDSAALIRKADQALYQAKARGKNQIALYHTEMREYERVSTSIMGHIAISPDTGEIILLQDLSEGGMRFRYQKPLPMATVLELSFPLPGRRGRISCKAKIQRVEELEQDQQYGIGASIIQMPTRDKKLLKAFIRDAADHNARPRKTRGRGGAA
ncbi:MAG: diguanylate cyclase [Thiogranum sp.]|nr:diguanylate cyclase [Thiogranum sp.]